MMQDMAQDRELLRGWKSISAHLSVSQSTAIRWSRIPGFPIRRTQHDAKSSVFAFSDELDAWLLSHEPAAGEPRSSSGERGPGPQPTEPDDQNEPSDPLTQVTLSLPPLLSASGADEQPATLPSAAVRTSEPVAPVRSTWSARKKSLVVAACAAAVLATGAMGWKLRSPTPADARTTVEIAELRSLMAERTSQALLATRQQARALHDRTGSAEALVVLAEANLLSSEFDDLDRSTSFGEAEANIDRAIDEGATGPNVDRIKGFLLYWRTRNLAGARPYFDRAIASDAAPYDAYLWYGNVLADAGRMNDAIPLLDKALELAPESPAVKTDRAFAYWQAGERAKAEQILADVEGRYPQFSGASYHLSLFRLVQGDVAGYLQHAREWSKRLKSPRDTVLLNDEAAAFDRGGPAGLQRYLADRRPEATTVSPFWYGGRLISAIAAAQLKDYPRLSKILEECVDKGEEWPATDFPRLAFDPIRRDKAFAPLFAQIFRKE